MPLDYESFSKMSEEFEFTQSSVSSTVRLVLPRSELFQYAQEALSGLRTVNGVQQFFPGAVHPELNGLVVQKIAAVNLERVDEATGEFQDFACTVSYGLADNQTSGVEGEDPVEIANIRYSVGSQEFTLPKGKMYFDTPDNPVPEDAANPILIIPMPVLAAKFNFKPTISAAAWSALVGAVNSTTFYGWAPETVMFQAPQTDQGLSSDGSSKWSHDYQFHIMPKNWNKSQDPSDGVWKYVYFNGDNKRYPLMDFTTYFGGAAD